MTTSMHALLGAYAVNSLSRRARSTFEAHLEGCLECRAELIRFRATTARLNELKLPSKPEDPSDSGR